MNHGGMDDPVEHHHDMRDDGNEKQHQALTADIIKLKIQKQTQNAQKHACNPKKVSHKE